MIVILGCNGMLGSMLLFTAQKYYPQLRVTGCDKSVFNALTHDMKKLDNLAFPGDKIINCIGAIPQKAYTAETMKYLNATFPKLLAEYCKRKGIKLIHISTNCVFSGKQANYTENDIPDAEDFYGITKRAGEPEYGLTIRCSIIGPEMSSYAGLFEWFLCNNADVINGYTDSYWNGLTTLQLSHIIYRYILKAGKYNGIKHYYSSEVVSKYALLDYIRVKFNKNIRITPKENGCKYYTLSSIDNEPQMSIYAQIDELYTVYNDFKVGSAAPHTPSKK